jgi:hypothetical protein
MKKLGLALLVSAAMALSAPLAATAQNNPAETTQMFKDRLAIEELLVRYTTGLDTLNADLYVSCFTEDATFGGDAEGAPRSQGHAQIRKIITDLIASRAQRAAAPPAAAAAPATPPAPGARPAPPAGPPVMHHVMTNAVIDIVSPTEARHHSYWMTVVGSGRSFTVAGMGRYEDKLVKQNGKWLIKERKLLR